MSQYRLKKSVSASPNHAVSKTGDTNSLKMSQLVPELHTAVQKRHGGTGRQEARISTSGKNEALMPLIHT